MSQMDQDGFDRQEPGLHRAGRFRVISRVMGVRLGKFSLGELAGAGIIGMFLIGAPIVFRKVERPGDPTFNRDSNIFLVAWFGVAVIALWLDRRRRRRRP